jgi:transcriptional regulator with XRE-family HTH domain
MSRNFGQVLRHCRALAGRSQLELALDAQVSPRHLSFLESGRAEPGPDVVARLASALEVPDTARNALFAAAGFAPAPRADEAASSKLRALERMILAQESCPSAVTDSNGRILAANIGMKALHASLTGVAHDLLQMSAAELALGPRGFGPYLTNSEALRARFEHCLALEQLIAGGAPVGDLSASADAPGSSEMKIQSELGLLTFDLVETVEGHPLHGAGAATARVYSMVAADRPTESAIATIVSRYRAAQARPKALSVVG